MEASIVLKTFFPCSFPQNSKDSVHMEILDNVDPDLNYTSLSEALEAVSLDPHLGLVLDERQAVLQVGSITQVQGLYVKLAWHCCIDEGHFCTDSQERINLGHFFPKC